MYFRKLQKTALFLIMSAVINPTSAQEVYKKLGNDPLTLDSAAVLEVASTNRGFLPPRMTRADRNRISNPAVGLQIWCTDCGTSGQLYVYTDTDKGWIPITMLIPPSTFTLTTAGRNDSTIANRPIRESATSATISGTLVSISGTPPTETGIVWKEITDNDFDTLPVLDALGSVATPTATAVTTAATPIKVTISDLTSANPYYFRTYAKNSFGVGYGNAVVFNVAPPQIKISPVTFNGNTSLPVFKGKLIVNASTPQGTITEYGYCVSTTDPKPTNKIVLSGTATGIAALASLNNQLNSEDFTKNPALYLEVNDYDVLSIAPLWFRFYAVANGETIYSDVRNFTPIADAFTGGTAVATVTKIDNMTNTPFQIGVASSGTIKVHFNVTKAGTYADFTNTVSGNTEGLSMATVRGGNFTVGNDQSLDFIVSGIPYTSLDGNSFAVSRITQPLNTGTILPNEVTGGTAIATVTNIDPLVTKVPLQIGVRDYSGIVKVHFNVTKAGTYADYFTSEISGDTQGISVNFMRGGNFTVGNQTLDFRLSSYPFFSLDGNSFTISRIGTLLSTGAILPNAVTGGSAVATINSIETISEQLTTGKTSASFFKVNLYVDRKGTYADFTNTISGNTEGLSMDVVRGGNFLTGKQTLYFNVSGMPYNSLDGNSFIVPRIGTLRTGAVLPDAITGGSAVATISSIDPISKQLTIGKNSDSSFKVIFNVTKPGTYADFTNTISGNTTDLGMETVRGGNFTVGNQTLYFNVYGTPYDSLDGNSFAVSRIGTLSTGTILPDAVTGGTAVATVSSVEPISQLTIGKTFADFFKVIFKVTKPGTYADFTNTISGNTEGLSMDTVGGGNFLTGNQTLYFNVYGTPYNSLDGNSFAISRIGTLGTGSVLQNTVTGGTAVATVTSIDPMANPQLKIDEVSTTSSITVHFNVTHAGTYYYYYPFMIGGNTKGVNFLYQQFGTFTAANAQSVSFPLVFSYSFDSTEPPSPLENYGARPYASLDGNTINMRGIGTLNTGVILIGDAPNGGKAYCSTVHKPMTFGTITSRTGRVWMDRNLGASRVAQSATDYEAYGCLYQWGRGNDGHASIIWTSSTQGVAVSRERSSAPNDSPPNDSFLVGNSSTLYTDKSDWRKTRNDNLWQGVNGINNPCPTGYKVPTQSEFEREMSEYRIRNVQTAFSSVFKFVTSGRRTQQGYIEVESTRIYLHTSTINDPPTGTVRALTIHTSTYPEYDKATYFNVYRSEGYSVRCIKD